MGRLSWSRDPNPNANTEDYLTVNQTEAEAFKQEQKTPADYYASQPESCPSPELSQRVKGNVFTRLRERHLNVGWRRDMIRVAIFSTLLWTANIIVYIVLFSLYGSDDGSGVLMESSCNSVQRANTGVHAALNVVTSLMLSASNIAMESLCSPTREEVDAAHDKKRWLGIGGMSLRNFRFIKRTRAILWILLWTTSIPLHLFFNAVFFTSSKAHQYSVAVVSSDFYNDVTWSPTAAKSTPSNFAPIGSYTDMTQYERPDNITIIKLLNEAKEPSGFNNFTHLSPHDCMYLYATGFLQRASDVVVFTDEVSRNGSPLIWTRYPERLINHDRDSSNPDPFNWICHDALQQKRLPEARKHNRCNVQLINEIADDHDRNPWTVYGAQVQFCLSRPQEDQCTLYYNVWLMLAVLVCGLIKTIIIIWVCVRHSRTSNLRSFGDAVNSFLEREDQTTKNLCLIPSRTFVKHGLRPCEPQRNIGMRQHWFISAGVKQFWITIAITLVYTLLFGVALAYAINGAHGSAFDYAFGQTDIQALTEVNRDDAGSSGVVPNLLVANIPQLGFSILYIIYNDILTKIFVAHEFNDYTKRPMGLRVSEKRIGAQQGSRFFNLPMHWGLSILGLSTLFHWLTSQSLFPVRVDGVNNEGVIDTNDQLTRLGYNCRAITALVCLLLVIAIFTTCIGWFRKFDVGFGEMGNSLVISAACHPPPEWNVDGDMGTKELSWGDVTIEREMNVEVRADMKGQSETQGEGEMVRHCSFAPVVPRELIVGAYYS